MIWVYIIFIIINIVIIVINIISIALDNYKNSFDDIRFCVQLRNVPCKIIIHIGNQDQLVLDRLCSWSDDELPLIIINNYDNYDIIINNDDDDNSS